MLGLEAVVEEDVGPQVAVKLALCTLPFAVMVVFSVL